jgi:hypothetical protein
MWQLRRVLPGLITALLAMLLAVPPAAVAGSPDAWGFAFMDNANPPPGFTLDPGHQWGSWKPVCAAQWATVTATPPGRYRVHFPCISGSTGIPHATAVDPAGVWCQVAGWNSAVDVDVWCFNSPANGGGPANSQFVVMFARSSCPPTSFGGAYGYVSYQGVVTDQYNSTCASNTVTPIGTGTWPARLPGLPQSPIGGNVQVTAVNSIQPVHCKVVDLPPNPTDTIVIVRCFDFGGNPLTSTGWTLSYQRERDILNRLPARHGYLLDTGSPPETNYRSIVPHYGVNTLIAPTYTFRQIGQLQDHVQVTAFGGNADYCQPFALWTTAGDATVPVRCFDWFGNPAGSQAFATYTTNS